MLCFASPKEGSRWQIALEASKRGHALAAVHAGRDILSGTDLADAITSKGGIANVTTVLAKKSAVEDSDDDDDDDDFLGGAINAKIPNITSYQYFKMTEGGVIVKRHGVIGEGKYVPLDLLPISDDFSYEVVPVKAIGGPVPQLMRNRKEGTSFVEQPMRKRLTKLHSHGEEETLQTGEAEEAKDDDDME